MSSFLQEWISNKDNAKALIKYEIRQLEGRLQRCFLRADILSNTEDVVTICISLAQFYSRLLEMTPSAGSYKEIIIESKATSSEWGACYTQIQILKQRLTGNRSLEKELQILKAIQEAYQKISQRAFAARPTCIEEPSFEFVIKPLSSAQTPEEWINALFDLSHSNHMNLKLAEMSSLSHEELWTLAQPFKDEAFLQITNAIFYYKLHPEKLFKDSLHPEKLMSIKNKLSLFYEYIEKLRSNLSQSFTQNGLPSFPDYLFHSEELPQGIEIPVDENCYEIIKKMVNSWRVQTVPFQQPVIINYLYDFFSAYKFWFNPNRLIDTAMILHQEFLQEFVSFQQQINLCFRQFTTTECLDLYGYFSNKDSCYLMRTLLAIKRGMPLSWLPSINPEEKAAICTVYEALECIMECLRNELSTRHINTDPYIRDVLSKEITPRTRNRNAVLRIMVLYRKECRHAPNDVMEKLFAEVETSV